MRCDYVSHARRVEGRFQNGHAGGAPPSRAARQHAAWGTMAPHLRLGNHPTHWLVGALLASTVVVPREPRTVSVPPALPTGGNRHGSHPAVAVALLPGAAAQPDYRPLATAEQAAPCSALAGIANAAVAACVASPRLCGTALGVATATAVAATLYGTVRGAIDGPATVIPSDAALPDTAASEQREALREAAQQISVVDPEDGHAESLQATLLRIHHDCGRNLTCRAAAINPLLERLSPDAVAGLLRILAPSAVALTSAPTQRSWPAVADAAPVQAGSALLALVDALGNLYSPEQAAFQYALERIVASTVRDGRDGREDDPARVGQRWFQANARRQETIAGLLERDVGPVTRLPYTLSGLTHLGIADGTTACNLHVTLPTSDGQPPTRRILVVAHGDMIGWSRGSEGALDNGSGVATLLHIGARFRENTPPPGTQVELLVTSYEELGFLGARAYVDQCLHRQDCPAFVINVDMTGRGGHGYAMSGTDALAGSPHLGVPTLYLQAPAVTPVEQRAREQLEQALAVEGFVAAPAGDTPWITSDNIAFQNASIPCVGISQMSAAAARLWKQLQDAREAWSVRDAQVDWALWQAQRDGTAELSPEQDRVLKDTYGAANRTYHVYQQLRDEHPNAPPLMIHGGRDRLHRVNPVMGVALADALVAGIRRLHWDAQGSRATSLPSTH